ncbi:MAG: hypothetical protein ACXAB7_02300 [Candidatus Kariarchaeaceae archaeon]|jgi:hypothetical protein
MEYTDLSNDNLVVSEPLEIFFHKKDSAPKVANFVLETVAKNLNLQAKTFMHENYCIGYFTAETKDMVDDIKVRFKRGFEMLRLLLDNKKHILSQATPCKKLPQDMVDLDVIAMRIFN